MIVNGDFALCKVQYEIKLFFISNVHNRYKYLVLSFLPSQIHTLRSKMILPNL